MRIDSGTKTVGTARVRDELIPAMTAAQRAIYKATGNPPQASALDDVDPLDPFTAKPVIQQPQVPAIAAKKPPKYRNTRCEHEGIKFDSLRERDRWIELSRLEAAGDISDLERQVVFVLADPVMIDGRRKPPLRYIADFVYERAGQTVIEDVKGVVTAGYRIKRHLMAARGLQITEVK
jgi:hypothetical protein